MGGQEEDDKRQREVRRRLEETQAELQEKRREELQEQGRAEERREATVVRGTFQSECRPPDATLGDPGLLSALSHECGIPEGDMDSRRLLPQQVVSLSRSLEELLFQDWEEHLPTMDTLHHARVLLAELCVMALDTDNDATLEISADWLQLAVETLGQWVMVAAANEDEDEEMQYLNFTQALFLTYTHLLQDRPDSQLSIFCVAKQWSQEDFSSEQLFHLKFLELLLNTLEEETGPVSGASEKCLELIIEAVGQMLLAEAQSFTALPPAVLTLFLADWTPLDALDFIGTLAKSRASPSEVLQVIELVKRHNLPPSWTNSQGHSLNNLLESTAEFNRFYSVLDEGLQRESIDSLDSLLAQVPEADRLRGVISAVQKDIIDSQAETKENKINGAKPYQGFNKVFFTDLGGKKLQAVLSKLSRAVLHAQGWWPTVAQMVRWCSLAIGNRETEFLTLETDPCVAAMYAALMVFQDRRVGMVLNSPTYRPHEWSPFYEHLGITEHTNTTVFCIQHVKADVVNGSLQSFVQDFLQKRHGLKGEVSTLLPDCIILGQPVSERDLCFPELSVDSELTQSLADLLKALLTRNTADKRFRLMHTFLHTLSTLADDVHLKEDLLTIVMPFLKQSVDPDQLYMMRFLEAFLRSACDTQTQEQCYELLIATSVKNCNNELCTKSFSKLSVLVKTGLWAPAEALDLFCILVKKFSSWKDVLTHVMTVLHTLEIHCVSSSFRAREGHTLTQLLDSESSSTLVFWLREELCAEREKSLEDILQEIEESNRSITKSTLQKVHGIVESLQTCNIETSEEPLKVCCLQMDDLQAVLLALCKAVKETQGWWPRNTQMVSWCLLALSKSGKLLQLGTGEGKSCVVAMFAAFRALRGKRVDVLSSSPILSKRDADEWRPFYSVFNISVDCNTDKEKYEDRKRCYSCDVVYGTAESFAADCLRQNFEMKEVRPGRGFQCVIVDEVDSLLLDKGVQMTYLSTDVAPMQPLNIVLAIIWGIVSQYGLVPKDGGCMIRGPVLPFFKALFDSVDTDEGLEPLAVLELAEEWGLVPHGFCKDCDSTDKLSDKMKTVGQDTMLQFFCMAGKEIPYDFITYTQNKQGTLQCHSDC